MLKRETEQRQAIEMLCVDMLVPGDHLLRKIDAAVDFTYIYDLVEDLYCEDNGRPSCDPVVLFKLVLIQHLFGIRSLRQTLREAEVNVAYRWFLGYTMSQRLPHFATVSYAFRHRFTAEVIEGVFRWILEEVARAGYLSPEVVFVDGTHIKANANLKKHVKKSIPVAAKRCVVKLDDKKARSKIARWQSIAEAAAKQSKRGIIPKVTEVMSFRDAVKLAADMEVRLIPYELAEGMDRTKEIISTLQPGQDVAVFIGPEGGFEESEIREAVAQGMEPITLGRRILRTETAGLTVLSWIMYQLEV